MSAVLDAPTFEDVTDDGRTDAAAETTGQEIKRRRTGMGMSISALSEASGVYRDTVAKIEADSPRVRSSSIGAVRSALDRLEEEAGMDLPSRISEGLVEFRVSGNFGVDVVVSGPVRDLPALEASVEKLVREMRQKGQPEG